MATTETQNNFQEIIDGIRAHVAQNNNGSYGEARIGAAAESLTDLENKVKSGDLSQSDYVAITNQIMPDLWTMRHTIASWGSAAANAANNAGGGKFDEQYAKYNIYKSGQDLLGRDLTDSEIAQALPIFSQANGVQLGNAWLANIAKVEEQNPYSPSNKEKSAQYGDQVNGYFKSMLGRDATEDEKQHFGQLMATGNVDAYGINQFLQGTPEYQGIQDQKFQTDINQKLTDTDVNFFNKAKQGVISQFMQQGTANSSALDSALADLMGQIADKRSQYMADLSVGQYGRNQDLALNNYGSSMNQYLSDQQYNRDQSQKNMDYLTGRSNELTDYNTMKNDYMNFANSAGSGSNAMGGALMGGVSGAGAGASLGPWGAVGGGIIGGIGGYLSSRR